MRQYKTGIAIRGKWIEDNLVEFGGRAAGITFLAPDPKRYLAQLPLGPARLNDLHALSFDEILDYIDRLGERLDLRRNPYLQEALEASCLTSSLTEPLLRQTYEDLPNLFNRDSALESVENTIGVNYLNGWVSRRMLDGRLTSVRAFGTRSLHIIAGNSPFCAAMSIVRIALTRGDGIIKSPSNDPFTALAIARTMIDMSPEHPITRHLAVAYWKGGDEALESKLYQPSNIERIVAWGGLSSVKHVTKYIQPGLHLISMDPKRSISIIGPEAFADETACRDVALRLAADIGAVNQEGCVSARVVYVISGTDDEGLARLNRLAELTYQALIALPRQVSTRPKSMDPELREAVAAARLNDEWYRVIGGLDDEGAIIASQVPEPVDFAPLLSKRIANLVPIDSAEDIYAAIDAYTQTVGIYPESLKTALRDPLAIHGAQRVTSLGYAANPALAAPQDAIEPLRQMCKWVVCEDCDPKVTTPIWEGGETFKLEPRGKQAQAL